jgi:hypothetical protein
MNAQEFRYLISQKEIIEEIMQTPRDVYPQFSRIDYNLWFLVLDEVVHSLTTQSGILSTFEYNERRKEHLWNTIESLYDDLTQELQKYDSGQIDLPFPSGVFNEILKVYNDITPFVSFQRVPRFPYYIAKQRKSFFGGKLSSLELNSDDTTMIHSQITIAAVTDFEQVKIHVAYVFDSDTIFYCEEA